MIAVIIVGIAVTWLLVAVTITNGVCSSFSSSNMIIIVSSSNKNSRGSLSNGNSRKNYFGILNTKMVLV